MNALPRVVDPQLPLSLLFLAVVEGQRQQRNQRIIETVPDEKCDFELAQEDPERWDGMV